MNSYDDASTSMSAQQKSFKLLLYYGFNSTQKAAPSNSQCDDISQLRQWYGLL